MSRFLVACAALAVAACGGDATEGTGKSRVSQGGATSNGGSSGASGFGGDGAPSPQMARCKLNSDCGGGLVCSFDVCHAECATSKDCPANQRCVNSALGNTGAESAVCQMQEEATCHYNSDCAAPLVCAVDLQCRNQCRTDLDCITSQRCVFGVCAEASEVDPSGQLKGATDAGAGFPGSGP